MANQAASIRYDGELYPLAEAIDLGAEVRGARQRATAAGPNTPALLTVMLATGAQVTLDVSAGTPIALIDGAATAAPRAAAKAR
ncbi:MAG TPA: hypothetical protein VGM70_00070 [Pseudolysinimonas sp.]|jgi:hypothetical protein